MNNQVEQTSGSTLPALKPPRLLTPAGERQVARIADTITEAEVIRLEPFLRRVAELREADLSLDEK